MRVLFAVLIFVLIGVPLAAQFASPVTFTTDSEHVEGDEFDLIVTARMERRWTLYSAYTPDDGPVPTSFTWDEGGFELVGELQEVGHRKEGYDEFFGTDVIKFLSDEPVVFTQRVRVTDYGSPINVVVEYMTCDDEQCLPPTEEEFSWDLAPPSPDRGAVAPATAPTEATGRAAAEPVSAAPRPTPPAPATAPAQNSAPSATYRATGPPARENDPISWVFEAERYGEAEYLLRMTGTLEPGWMTYSMDVDPDLGPFPTEFAVETGSPRGPVTETSPTLKEAYDDIWEADVKKIIGGTVTYEQRIDATGAEALTGYVVYQICKEVCFPPRELPFALDLSGPEPVAGIDGGVGTTEGVAVTEESPTDGEEAIYGVTLDPDPAGSCSVGEAKTRGRSLLGLFALGFGGGLFALIMPCIFPMIPLTVSFFTKSDSSRAKGIRNAAMYGFFIFLIYVLLSVPFHLVEGLSPNLLNDIASNVWLNLFFFAVFMFFAGSFFGFYELALPESWSNRASQAEGAGGVVGIFFMALTLALVSFSCTGPILGSVLVQSLTGGAWPLTAAMAGFGVALGLPFALFAAFPEVLNRMPKSGGWLNSVKVVLGFVEVALATKFLSNADLVGEWDMLRIEPFLGIWILCALGVAAYLFKLISFPLDSPRRNVGAVGGLVAAASIGFAVYLGVGLSVDPESGVYRTRNWLSGIAPPVCYTFFEPCEETNFKSLEEGLAFARSVGKPAMIDFTGYTCVNCRKMEENVWTDDRIQPYLEDEYVIISLYVDDRSELPAAEHMEVDRLDGTGRTRLIDQVGEKWHYLQQTVYERSSQPYYVLVSPDGQTLNAPVAYTPDVDEYENFLACGLRTFREMSK